MPSAAAASDGTDRARASSSRRSATSLRRASRWSLSACPSAGMSECRIIRKQRNIAAAQAAAGNTANRNLKGTSSGQEATRQAARGLGGEARWPLEHVGPHEDGSAGAIHEDARCATLCEKDDRGEQRRTHPTPRRSRTALWAHRSPRHRHPERDAEQHDQHHQQHDDGDLQHRDDRTICQAFPRGNDGAVKPDVVLTAKRCSGS